MRIFSSLSCSLDGRITPPDVFDHIEISSPEDIARLKSLRDQADIILYGGGSLRAFSGVRRGHSNDKTPYQFIITRKPVNVKSKLFLSKCVTYIFSKEPINRCLSTEFDNVFIIDTFRNDSANVVSSVLQQAVDLGCKSILVEGGGQILGLFLKEQKLNELYLTICPYIFGDDRTPPLVGGVGFSLAHAPRLHLQKLETNGSELFLDYDVIYERPLVS